MTHSEIGNFKIHKKCIKTNARISSYTLHHGTASLPTFMPVATKACMKATLPQFLDENIILSNTYHCRNLKHSLESFMSYKKPMLTDSGGFQIVSLKDAKVSEKGVTFYDNEEVLLKPEDSIRIQNFLGADIIMQLDDVVNPLTERKRVEEAMYRSIRWLKRCIDSHENTNQILFPIVQGGLHEDLRKTCITEMLKNNVKGIAIGGLSGGENKEDFIRIVRFCINNLPKEIPKYVMGVGYPEDVLCIIALGADMSDCVYPTRTARFGRAFTDYGDINLAKAEYKNVLTGVEGCGCFMCVNHSLGYVHSLKGTSNYCSLISIHNIFYMRNLVNRAKKAIMEDCLEDFVKEWASKRFGNSIPSFFRQTFGYFGIEL